MGRLIDPRRRTATFLIVACVTVLAGCGKSDPFERQPVRGTVTWKGKPISFGSVVLEPAAGQGAGAMAAIRDGKFELSRTAGPSPGDYAVWVHAFDKSGDVPPGTPPGQEGPPPKDILPEKYRLNAAAIVKVERVGDDKPNELTITLD